MLRKMYRYTLLFLSFFFCLSIHAATKADYYEQYNLIYSSKSWKEGEALMRKAVKEFPDELHFYSYLCETLRGQNKFTEAFDLIEPLYNKHAKNELLKKSYMWNAYYLALHKRAEGKPGEALKLIKLSYGLFPEDLSVILWYGIILRETGSLQESIALLEKGDKLHDNEYITGNLIYSYVEQAKVLTQEERPAEAEEYYKKGFKVNDTDLTLLLWYGIFLRQTGRKEESVTVLEKADKLHDNEYVTGNLVESYVSHANSLKTGDRDRAEEFYKKAASVDSDSLTYLLWYGIFLREKGQYGESIKMLDRGMELYPDNQYCEPHILTAYLEYGWEEESKENYKKAIQIFREAEKRFPGEILFQGNLFICYYKSGILKKAEDYFVSWIRLHFLKEMSPKEKFDGEINIAYRLRDLLEEHYKKKQYNKALKIIDRVEPYFVYKELFYTRKGEALITAGQVEKGIKLMYRAYDIYIAKHPEFTRSITLELPMKGTLIFAAGPNSRETITHAGVARFCVDLMGSTEGGDTKKPTSKDYKTNEDYIGFGQLIYSPVDGVVIDARDGEKDHLPTTDYKYLSGNSITIQDARGLLYVFVHNKQNSARVKKGDQVKKGDILAELGNSGSTVPHLHFGVWTSDWTVSIPIIYKSYTHIKKDGTRVYVEKGTPEAGDVIINE